MRSIIFKGFGNIFGGGTYMYPLSQIKYVRIMDDSVRFGFQGSFIFDDQYEMTCKDEEDAQCKFNKIMDEIKNGKDDVIVDGEK
jgi:hypothetical protein